MKATLHIDGKATSIELSFEDIASIVSNVPDTPENAGIFEIFSVHPSAAVREYVAGKDNLNGSTVQILAEDKFVDVLRRLVRSDNARDCLDTEQLLSIIDRDIEAAKNIASYVESYAAAETDEITAYLLKHPDPQVRAELAGNSSASKKALRSLLKDEDAAVRYAAKRTLD
jgi:hypothetical protein